MHRVVVRLRALHVGVRAHRPARAAPRAAASRRAISRSGLVELELGERPVRDPVRLDADAARLELARARPSRASGCERRARAGAPRAAAASRPRDVADRDEDHRRVAVRCEHRQRVLEVVAVAVVEGDQHGARRQRRAVDVVVEHRVEVDDRCSRARRAAPICSSKTRRPAPSSGSSGRSLTLWYMRTRSVRSASSVDGAGRRSTVSPIVR